MMSKVTLFLLNVLLVASIGLRGAEQTTTDSQLSPVTWIQDVNLLIMKDDLDSLKKHVDMGLDLKDYSYGKKKLRANWEAQRLISPLINARSPEMVDFLVSQGLDVNAKSEGFIPLHQLLHDHDYSDEDFEKAFNQENWPVVLRHLKLIKAIDRLKELGAKVGEDPLGLFPRYVAYRSQALEKLQKRLNDGSGSELSSDLRGLITELTTTPINYPQED